jgi:hypothetical protein
MIYFCGLMGNFIGWKCAFVQFLKEVPPYAHTPQALSTGRYPLQPGLGRADCAIKSKLPTNYQDKLIFIK